MEKKEWIKALKLSLVLYKDNLKLFVDVLNNSQTKQEKMLPFMKEIAKKYVETLGAKSINELAKEKDIESQIETEGGSHYFLYPQRCWNP